MPSTDVAKLYYPKAIRACVDHTEQMYRSGEACVPTRDSKANKGGGGHTRVEVGRLLNKQRLPVLAEGDL